MPALPHRSGWRSLIARHLFGYLTALAALVVVASILLAREELAHAAKTFDFRWLPVVLGLSSFNYLLRFLKWHLLIRDAGADVPPADNARLYFACLAMVVTPARLGELYKLVFLRRLHGVPAALSLPPLVLERVTDALAVLALVSVQPFAGSTAVAVVALVISGLVLVGWGLSHPGWRQMSMAVVGRVGVLRSRTAGIERFLDSHARLLEPKSLGPSLVLSTFAWWAECVGLWIVCKGLDEALGVSQATWIYALSTLLGNLTFLPGGIGGTELSLVALLRSAEVSADGSVAAMALIRAGTLWFAVAIGLAVALIFRRRLRWREVSAEAASGRGGAD